MEKQTDEETLLIILDIVEYIEFFSRELTLSSLKSNRMLRGSLVFELTQLSENNSKLSDEFKNKHTNIPWHKITGLRNKIVHEYDKVNLETVFYVVTRDIPAFHEELLKSEIIKTQL